MTLFHAFLLGILQGLTEFIPVSSTAHLLILENLLGLPPNGSTFSFSIIVQLGTVFALIAFFWKDFWHILKAFCLGILHRRPFETLFARLGWLVVVASLPALLAGFLLKDVVQHMFRDPYLQAGIRLLITAGLLAFVEYFDKRNRTLEVATWMDALFVGLFEILAIFPGASRSGSTIAGGMVRGFDRLSATRFAFLMSAPILLAAGGYETWKVIAMPGTHEFLPHLVTGFATSAAVGWISIKWLIHYVSRHSFYAFVVYCGILGTVLMVVQTLG
jgi:undecaprenyl-diphosphatase